MGKFSLPVLLAVIMVGALIGTIVMAAYPTSREPTAVELETDAGSATLTRKTYVRYPAKKDEAHWVENTIAWTSPGTADGEMNIDLGKLVQGLLIGLRTIPGTDTEQPDDDYDITLLRNGHDIMNGAGVDRDEANTEELYGFTDDNGVVGYPMMMNALTLHLDNVGSATTGVIVLSTME